MPDIPTHTIASDLISATGGIVKERSILGKTMPKQCFPDTGTGKSGL